MGIIGILSILTMIFYEYSRSKLTFTRKENSPPDYEIEDPDVLEEIKLLNETEGERENFAVEVKNLEQNFSGMCNGIAMKNSINKLNFHLAKGECFALLGLNGAGKTTTFKCLTNEIFPTSGEIKINGLELSKNFSSCRNIIGYCPQFDAIFEYMTVYENLYFYSCIKGIPQSKVFKFINLA